MPAGPLYQPGVPLYENYAQVLGTEKGTCGMCPGSKERRLFKIRMAGFNEMAVCQEHMAFLIEQQNGKAEPSIPRRPATSGQGTSIVHNPNQA